MIETEHMGHPIRYGENSNEWTAPGLDLTASSLSALKTKINQWDAAKRRVSNMPVLTLAHNMAHGWGNELFEEATAVLLDADGTSIWVNKPSLRHGVKGDRVKMPFDRVALDNEHNRASLAAVSAKRKLVREIQETIKEIEQGIQRVSPADLLTLDKIADLPEPRKRSRR